MSSWFPSLSKDSVVFSVVKEIPNKLHTSTPELISFT